MSYFCNKLILQAISCKWINPGCYSILGPNGAGKTTLLHFLAGLIKAQSGNVRWYKRNVEKIPMQERAKILAYMPQNEHIPKNHTVLEVMHFARYPRIERFRGLRSNDQNIMNKILHALGLANFKNRPIMELSGGEYQRFKLACCLFQDSKIILLDEPLLGLDVDAKWAVCSTLKRWSCKQDAIIVMASHDINMAMLWSDEILVLNDGQVKLQGLPRFVGESGIIEEIYQNRLMRTQVDGHILYLPKVVSLKSSTDAIKL